MFSKIKKELFAVLHFNLRQLGKRAQITFRAVLLPKVIWHNTLGNLLTSVADPGCLSPVPDPDFYPSRIPDPKTTAKERGEKKLVVIPFFIATNFT